MPKDKSVLDGLDLNSNSISQEEFYRQEYHRKERNFRSTQSKLQCQDAKSQFDRWIKDEDYHKFEVRHWRLYFIRKYEQHGRKYVGAVDFKEKNALTYAFKSLGDWKALKLIIDFLFDSPQNFYDKRVLTLLHLSGGRLQKLLVNAQDWKAGKFKNPEIEKKKLTRVNREWIDEDSEDKIY